MGLIIQVNGENVHETDVDAIAVDRVHILTRRGEAAAIGLPGDEVYLNLVLDVRDGKTSNFLDFEEQKRLQADSAVKDELAKSNTASDPSLVTTPPAPPLQPPSWGEHDRRDNPVPNTEVDDKTKQASQQFNDPTATVPSPDLASNTPAVPSPAPEPSTVTGAPVEEPSKEQTSAEAQSVEPKPDVTNVTGSVETESGAAVPPDPSTGVPAEITSQPSNPDAGTEAPPAQ